MVRGSSSRVVLFFVAAIACSSEKAGGPVQGPEEDAEGPAAVPPDAARPTPKPPAPDAGVPDVAAADVTTPPPAPDAAVADSAPTLSPDTAAPLGEFPLAAVRAARPEKLVTVATPCEGPSWIDGEVFFGFRDGLMRISKERKLFRYIPELAFSVGTYKLGDGTLLVCDRANKLVQVLKDGKVAVLADEQATNSNDVT